MKKLLAIVMVVAMMFSMSVVAMADEAAYTVSAVAERNADGTTTVYLSVKGNVQAYGVEIATTDATPIIEYVEGCEGDPEAMEFATDDFMGVVNMNVANVTDGTVILTGAATSPKAKNYDGSFATITYEGIVETSAIVINDTVNGVAYDAISLNVALPTPVPTDTPAPTAEPTKEPTPVDPTKEPAPVDPTKEPAPVDPTQAPTTPSDNNKTEAPKTADVAPIATMITLVVVAGLAIVALKKRATN